MRKQYTKQGTIYYLKDGAEVSGTDSQEQILEAAAKAYATTPQRLVVTSGDEGYRGDGVHSYGSEHYEGDGLDFRIWGLPNAGRTADQIAAELGPNFDVVYGAAVDHRDHIHVEKDI